MLLEASANHLSGKIATIIANIIKVPTPAFSYTSNFNMELGTSNETSITEWHLIDCPERITELAELIDDGDEVFWNFNFYGNKEIEEIIVTSLKSTMGENYTTTLFNDNLSKT